MTTWSWTFGPSLPVRSAQLSSARERHPPDPRPCAGTAEAQRRTSAALPRRLAPQRERQTDAMGGTAEAADIRWRRPRPAGEASVPCACQRAPGPPGLAGRLDKPELLGVFHHHHDDIKTRDFMRVCACPRPSALTPPVLTSSIQADTFAPKRLAEESYRPSHPRNDTCPHLRH